MSRYRVRAPTLELMAEAVIACFDHARGSADDFTVGPLDTDRLAVDGLELAGDADGAAAALEPLVLRGVTVRRLA